MPGVAACGGAGRGYDHYTGALRSVPPNFIVSQILDVSGVAACGGAGRGYDHYTGALRFVPQNLIVSQIIDVSGVAACGGRDVDMTTTRAH